MSLSSSRVSFAVDCAFNASSVDTSSGSEHSIRNIVYPLYVFLFQFNVLNQVLNGLANMPNAMGVPTNFKRTVRCYPVAFVKESLEAGDKSKAYLCL